MSEVETQEYTITGLVDIFDEQGNITGQYPIGSVQTLPVETGDRLIGLGTVELFLGEEVAEVAPEEEAPAADDIAARGAIDEGQSPADEVLGETISDDDLDETLADLPGADDDLDLDLEEGNDEVE